MDTFRERFPQYMCILYMNNKKRHMKTNGGASNNRGNKQNPLVNLLIKRKFIYELTRRVRRGVRNGACNIEGSSITFVVVGIELNDGV